MTDDTSRNPRKSGAPPRGSGFDDEGSIFHRVRTDTLKRKVESMLKEGVLKNLVSELKLPREIVTHIMAQVDDTKQAALGVVSKEVRLFFDNTNLSEELTRVLSQLSFEVTTRVRFVRNDKEKLNEQSSGQNMPVDDTVPEKVSVSGDPESSATKKKPADDGSESELAEPKDGE